MRRVTLAAARAGIAVNLAAVDHRVPVGSALDGVRFWLDRKTRLDDGRDAPSCAVIDKHNTLNTGGKAESSHDSRGRLHAENKSPLMSIEWIQDPLLLVEA